MIEEINNVADINQNILEGRLLLMAIVWISLKAAPNLTHNEIIEELKVKWSLFVE